MINRVKNKWYKWKNMIGARSSFPKKSTYRWCIRIRCGSLHTAGQRITCMRTKKKLISGYAMVVTNLGSWVDAKANKKTSVSTNTCLAGNVPQSKAVTLIFVRCVFAGFFTARKNRFHWISSPLNSPNSSVLAS